MSKLIILMPDGVGVRNYIHTHCFDIDQKIDLLHPFKSQTLKELAISKNINPIKLSNFKESWKEKLLRESVHLARLKLNSRQESNPSILSNYMPKKNGVLSIVFYFIVELIAKLIGGNYEYIRKTENFYQKLVRKNRVYKKYLDFFKSSDCTTLFCTHQRAIIAAYLFAAANDAGLKTITSIYSWDNLPKARMALQANEYFVWSPYMKEELKSFYQEITGDQIKITGTPQFMFHYQNDTIWSRQQFAEYYQLDMNKRWICFSGDDKTTSPYDQDFLYDIARTIAKDKELYQNIEILLRPVPVEGFEKYEKVIDQFPELIKKTGAAWNRGSKWSDRLPDKLDNSILASLCHHAEAVINLGSTMALDFGMHEKAAIYINYDTKPDPNWSIHKIYEFQHFRTMKGLEPVVWLNSPSKLIDILKNLNKYKDKTKIDMKKWCEVIMPEGLRTKSSHLINEELIQ